jgi:hypothetical protein
VFFEASPLTDDESIGFEKRKEIARMRAKKLKENAEMARRKQQGISQTPGVSVKGYEFTDDSPEERISDDLESMVTDYILRRGGFLVEAEDAKVMSILARKREPDVAATFIAKITGTDEKYGLARKFFPKRNRSIKASKFEDGTIIEYGIESYKAFVSRTYYVVRGWEFYPFAQHNYRKSD